MTIEPKTTAERIRAAGGIVHRDGNIFFTNEAQFLAASPTAQAAPAAAEGPIVAYRISDPNEPDLGHWLSEEPGAAWCKSEPLCLAAPAAQPSPVAQGDAEDAARYRWLREHKALNNTHCWHFQGGPIIPGLLTLDAAIDAARKQGGA